MPFIPDYSNKQAIQEEPRLIMPPLESPIEAGLHEALHIVVARLDGLDIADVVEHEDRILTSLVEPQRFTPAALMAPEVFFVINNIAFKDHSVSGDRNDLAECFKPEAIEKIRRANWEWLELVFECPHIRAAVDILSARLDEELRMHGRMDGTTIHHIVDPILKLSPHADGLN
jgi:hypothetical protein